MFTACVDLNYQLSVCFFYFFSNYLKRIIFIFIFKNILNQQKKISIIDCMTFWHFGLVGVNSQLLPSSFDSRLVQ